MKKIERAYSLFELKSVDDERRMLEGIATTPTPDRFHDVVEPMGMEFKLPLPLLYQHNPRQPIGHVIDAKVSKDGIRVKMQMASAGVAAYIDEAWALIKARLVGGLSIGFRSIEDTFDRETGGVHFLRSEWIELSAVTIPAQSEATITAIKSIDQALMATSGTRSRIVRLDGSSTATRPGVTGITQRTDMTLQEQLTSFEQKRASIQAQMEAQMTKAGDEGRTLDATESESYDTHASELTACDEHIGRLRKHMTTIVARAAEVPSAPGAEKRSPSPSGVIQVTRNAPKGAAFAKYVIALYQAGGNRRLAAEIAKEACPDFPEIEMVFKTEVAAASTSGSTWASPLMPSATQLFGEFLELLRPMTLIGRIPGLRQVPFRVTVPAQTGGATFGWVGELQAKPVSAMAFDTVTLDFHKVAGIVPVSKELLRFSNPAAENIITSSMVADTAQFIDSQFVDPAVHVSTGVHPGSITDQIIPKAASGLTAAAFRADLAVVIGTFITANDDPSKIVVLMSATVAMNMSLIRNALGQKEFPDLTVMGGSIEGFPVIVSQAVGARIVFVKAADILYADGGIEIDMSQEASLVMTTTPDSSPLSTEMVSMFQRNMVAIRVEKFVTWKRGRSTSVAYINSAVYSG